MVKFRYLTSFLLVSYSPSCCLTCLQQIPTPAAATYLPINSPTYKSIWHMWECKVMPFLYQPANQATQQPTKLEVTYPHGLSSSLPNEYGNDACSMLMHFIYQPTNPQIYLVHASILGQWLCPSPTNQQIFTNQPQSPPNGYDNTEQWTRTEDHKSEAPGFIYLFVLL